MEYQNIATVNARGLNPILTQVEVKKPGKGEVLLKNIKSSICTATEINSINGTHIGHDEAVAFKMLPHHAREALNIRYPALECFYPDSLNQATFPQFIGHECVSEIQSFGDGVESVTSPLTGEKLSLGDHVTTYKIPHAFSEYSVLSLENIVKIPSPSITDYEAALFEPALININAVRQGLEQTSPTRVLITGAGCQGALATQFCAAYGVPQIVTTDFNAYRRKRSLEFGADITLNPDEPGFMEQMYRITDGRGFDLILECAGTPSAIQLIPYVVRRGGAIGQIGALCEPVFVEWGYIHFRHFNVFPVALMPSLLEAQEDMAELFRFMVTGKLQLNEMITHEFPLSQITEAFEFVRNPTNDFIKVAIDNLS